ncbi:MAG: DegT/DnrJ/EryC1/StrS family aminotransferase [Oscillospiraceae bacterium]
MKTPFCDALAPLLEKPARFYMPGHKGNPAANPAFGGLLRYEITEIEGADDLSHPSGPLAESQANMTAAYGSGATLYSAFGSTSCILAMLALFAEEGGPIVMVRGCHIAAVRGLAFLNLAPTWVWPQNGPPTANEIEAALAQRGAKTVYITSPDYYGRMADVNAIAGVCRRYGARLLVDNAHGAHLRFVGGNLHPLFQGADATCDSAHKTLPCLTPAALLHLKDAALAPAARQALNLFSSTSPSYLVLQSLDYTAGLLLENRIPFETTAKTLAAAAAGSAHLLQHSDDPLKLCLVPWQGGYSAAQLEGALADEGIVPELADGTHVVLMVSPYNTEEDFARLKAALAKFPPRAPLAAPRAVYPRPRAVCGVRQALFGPKQRLPVEQAEGRVAAGLVAPCPPGVPLVVPGEQIPPGLAPLLAAGGILELDVVK